MGAETAEGPPPAGEPHRAVLAPFDGAGAGFAQPPQHVGDALCGSAGAGGPGDHPPRHPRQLQLDRADLAGFGVGAVLQGGVRRADQPLEHGVDGAVVRLQVGDDHGALMPPHRGPDGVDGFRDVVEQSVEGSNPQPGVGLENRQVRVGGQAIDMAAHSFGEIRGQRQAWVQGGGSSRRHHWIRLRV